MRALGLTASPTTMKACNSSARTPAATTATNTKALAALFGEALQSTPPAAASTHISGVRPRSGTARIARWAGVGERIRVSHATTYTTNRTLMAKPRPLSPGGWWLAVKDGPADQRQADQPDRERGAPGEIGEHCERR